MATNTYSFLDVAATLVGPGGTISLGAGSGAAEEGIDVSPAGDLDTMQVGADGTGQHTLHADKSGRITVRLLKTSPVNGLLSAMLALQRTAASLHGQNTIVVNNLSNGDVITARQVAFAKVPSLGFGKEAGVVEWEFNAVAIDAILGGV